MLIHVEAAQVDPPSGPLLADGLGQVVAGTGDPFQRIGLGMSLCTAWAVNPPNLKRDQESDDIQFKINLPDESFHSYRCDAPALEIDVSKDELVDMYTKMVRPLFFLTRNST